EIVLRENSSIEEIFGKNGEEYFRTVERNVLEEITQKDNVIVSTGGGLPCFFDNMTIINLSGQSIFLDVPVEDICERLIASGNQNRPMTKGKTREEILSFLKGKYEERIPFYGQASITIRGNYIQAKDLLQQLPNV
ncbi:MAG: shikimate kinase, partial [Cytophagaceae bacterium]